MHEPSWDQLGPVRQRLAYRVQDGELDLWVEDSVVVHRRSI